MNIQELGFHLIKVNLGSYSKEEEIILTESICIDETLYQHEIYRFPIEFTNHNYESYRGKKAQLFFRLKPYLLTKENGKIKDKTEEYQIQLLDNQEEWTTKNYLDFKTKHPKHTISPQKTTLTLNSCLAIFTYSILSLFLGLSVMSMQQSIPELLIKIYLIGLGIIIFISQYISNFVLGEIYLEIEGTMDGHFLIHIDNEKKWQQIHRISAYIEIQEFTYGAKSNSKDSNIYSIYKSSPHKFKPPYENLILPFKFPKDVPVSLRVKKFKIDWALKLKLATTFGLNFNFDWVFLVDKHYR